MISLSTSISVPQYDLSKLVDYSKLIAEAFAYVTTFLIMRVGLNVLKAVQGRSELIGLPTWVPDWSICEIRELDIVLPDANIWNLTEAELHFPELEGLTKSGTMVVRGFRIGTIADMGHLCNVGL